MNARTQGTPLSAVALIALSASAFAACGRIPGQFEIVQNQVPQAGCVISNDESALYRGSGVMDLSLVFPNAESGFFVHPLMKNNLGSSSGGIDTNEIILESFAVDISYMGSPPPATKALLDSLAGSALMHYRVPWSGKVSSGGGRTPAFVPSFPVELANQILAKQEVTVSPSSLSMNLQIRAFGHTTVQDIESDPFIFPISVCAGCLIANVQPCPYKTAPSNPGDVCNISQDTSVDCCSVGGELVCPAVVAAQ